MRVFLTGATGYIGRSVARALRRAGHDVHGLCRSADKGKALAADEVHPVVGDMTKPDGWRAIAESCSVLIHAAFDMKGGVVGPDRTVVDAFLAAAKRGAQPTTVIYTSGVWVHGNTGATLVDESNAPAPIKAVAWRPAHEQLVLSASGVRGLVIRPGCVYGGAGGMTGSWFELAKNGGKSVVGDGTNRWALVHVEDLADAYVRAAESGLGGEIFDVTDRSRNTVAECAKAAARAAGYDGPITFTPVADAAKQMGDFAEALALDQHVDARKAVRLLGWQPKHGGFVDDVQTYYEAWRATRG